MSCTSRCSRRRTSYRWDGNLKKYKYAVVDPDGAGPQSARGHHHRPGHSDGCDRPCRRDFSRRARAASGLTPPTATTSAPAAQPTSCPTMTRARSTRYLGTNPAGTTSRCCRSSMRRLLRHMVGAADATQRTAVLDFVRARDAARMGDPMHSVPQVVTYGGTAAAPIDVAFVATNDGFLHAINAADASGAELWSFVPQELLSRLKPLMDNADRRRIRTASMVTCESCATTSIRTAPSIRPRRPRVPVRRHATRWSVLLRARHHEPYVAAHALQDSARTNCRALARPGLRRWSDACTSTAPRRTASDSC